MKKTIIMLFIASTFANSARTVSKRDKKFVEFAAANGIFEIKTAELAQTKAITPEIKELGETLAKQRNN